MTAFKPLHQTSFKRKGSIIAEQILEMIQAGGFHVGDKLPPERIIAEQMGVSRPSVREAISALQISGILSTRPGDGTYVVAPPASEGLADQALAVLEKSDSPYEMLQARRAFEIGVMRLAVEIASDEDIAEIKKTWEKRCEKALKKDFEAYTMGGKEFHLAIARATKNRLIVKMMDKLLDAMQQPLWVNMRKAYYEEDTSRINQMMDVHNEIIDAMLARNTERAIQAIEADFDHVLEQLYTFNEY